MCVPLVRLRCLVEAREPEHLSFHLGTYQAPNCLW